MSLDWGKEERKTEMTEGETRDSQLTLNVCAGCDSLLLFGSALLCSCNGNHTNCVLDINKETETPEIQCV